MSTPASIKGHPVHPMLIGLPVGLFVFSFISELIYLMNWGSILWLDVAYLCMLGGVIGALVAAIPGFIDYLSINDDRTKAIGTRHMIANLVVVALFAVNVYLRTEDPDRAPYGLTLAGLLVLGYAGWQGWNMVYKRGMGVDMEEDIQEESRGHVNVHQPGYHPR